MYNLETITLFNNNGKRSTGSATNCRKQNKIQGEVDESDVY